MHRALKIALLTIIVAAVSGSVGLADESTTFERMSAQYERIRLSLLDDGLDDVAEAASQINNLSLELEENFSEQLAGIQPGNAEELGELLPSINSASVQLTKADVITGARESFANLSKAMVQYRRLVGDSAVAVAFCPMARKFWLQPNGEIGNPYYGQSMAGCGEFVSE